jgi:hypothetical protein
MLQLRIRVIIVVVQVGAVKIHVAPVGQKERQDETQFTNKIGGKTSLGPRYYSNSVDLICSYTQTGDERGK